jgi:hypothetical protein
VCTDRSSQGSKILEIDAELLAFFIEMASFETECFGGLGDVPFVTLQFLQDLGPFEYQHSL